MKKPKILFLDIETSFMIAGIFQSKINGWVPDSNIFQPWFIICSAWKWYGQDKIHAVSVNKKDLTDDTRVVKKMIEVINKADIIVGHNVAAFDLKKINTRALKHRLTSFNPCQVVDTLKVARKEFLLHANSLDAIAKFLGVGRKQDTTRGLWQRIAMGDHTALKEMVEYNKNDVAIQEKVYEEMLPYITNHPNLNVIMESGDLICTNCGSDKVHRNGYRTTRAGKYARYRCQCCGAGFRAKKLIKTFDGR